METNKEKKFNDSPLKERKCLCGCELMFIPKRSDQFHLNKLHTNRAYNEGKRKQVSKNQIKAEKQLRKNDKLLEKYHKHHKKNEAVVISLTLKAEGFDYSLYIGQETQKDELYYKSYNYLFREYELQGVKLTKILFQKTKIYVKH